MVMIDTRMIRGKARMVVHSTIIYQDALGLDGQDGCAESKDILNVRKGLRLVISMIMGIFGSVRIGNLKLDANI